MTELIPGWACDGNSCWASSPDTPGLTTNESLERAGWLVEHVYGEVRRAWCPHCRRGKQTIPFLQESRDVHV